MKRVCPHCLSDKHLDSGPEVPDMHPMADVLHCSYCDVTLHEDDLVDPDED